MALDFPSSPALNDTYTEAGKTWRWNGSGWQLVTTGTVTNADISATAEIAVSKLADGSARQLLQTDAAGTGVEWTSNVDVPGTLDVTGATTLDSTLSVPLGSASAPSIYPGTDTNTGIYSPGADQLAISTNGTGRLFINSSGQVGLGNSSPGSQDVSANTLVVGNTSSKNGISIVSATNEPGSLFFADGTSGADAFRCYLQYNHGNDGLEIGVNGSAAINIDSSRRVGIGTLSVNATRKVEIVQPSGYSAGLRILTDGSGAYTEFFGGTSNFRIGSPNATSALVFEEGATERARIDSSGRLLIGTSTSLDSTSQIQNYVSSGQIRTYTRSDNLSNGNVCSFQALAYVNSANPRYADLAVYKHSGITNACGFLQLNCEDAAFNYLWVDNSDILRISTNDAHIGTTSGTVVGAQTSDERIKNILGPVEYGLAEIKQLDPVSYALKSDPEQVPHLGFIAQQVNPIIPESVFDTDDHIEGEPEGAPTKLGMEYVALIPVLVNAIKELSAEVDALKAQLQTS
jgi:hypothetical protein